MASHRSAPWRYLAVYAIALTLIAAVLVSDPSEHTTESQRAQSALDDGALGDRVDGAFGAPEPEPTDPVDEALAFRDAMLADVAASGPPGRSRSEERRSARADQALRNRKARSATTDQTTSSTATTAPRASSSSSSSTASSATTESSVPRPESVPEPSTPAPAGEQKAEPTASTGQVAVEPTAPAGQVAAETTSVPSTSLPSTTITTIRALTPATQPSPTPTSERPPTSGLSSTPSVTTSPATSSTGSSSTSSTAGGPHHDPGLAPAPSALAALRNDNPDFNRFHDVASDRLDINALTFATSTPDNGTVGDGQFRVTCQYSHFANDDPIVHPGRPGAAHLHMFFGNTEVDANSTNRSLLDSGGGSCSGFELNRSGYWTPTLINDHGDLVVPDFIVVYYKTKWPQVVQPLPQGLKMLAGSAPGATFTASSELAWTCGPSGFAYGHTNRIPDCGGDPINATVVFPQCWDGVNLDSADHRSHLAHVPPSKPCPSSHPVRLPQISVLLYYPGQDSVDGWHLSSDNPAAGDVPGSSLHADWWGGWNTEITNIWMEHCLRRARNCSLGQTGTERQLAKVSPLHDYPGPNVLALP